MFEKKCRNCNERVSRKFEFCPYCGNSLSKKEDYGMLGNNDNINMNPEGIFGSPMFNKIFSSAIKMLEKELTKEMKEIDSMSKPKNMLHTNFELYINGKKIDLGNPVKILPQKHIAKQKISSPSQEIIEKSKMLPRKEAKTELKRYGNSITYELEVPGVKSLEQVLVTKLEASFEIKAFAENCVYIKNLPIKLTLVKYYLKNGILSLEFQGK